MTIQYKALIRDLNYLINLRAVTATKLTDPHGYLLKINLQWPMEITETEFFKRIKNIPKGKVHGFLSA